MTKKNDAQIEGQLSISDYLQIANRIGRELNSSEINTLVLKLLGTSVGHVEQGHRLAWLEVELHLILAHLVAQLQRELSQWIIGRITQPHRVAAGRLADAAAERRLLFLETALVGAALLLELQRHKFAQMREIALGRHL